MKVSQDAHVVLSLGPQNVTIPELEGESVRVARIQLLQAGLQLGEVTSLAVPISRGLGRAAESTVGDARRESARELLIAQGSPPAAYIMPWLVGMQLPDADRLISSGGLKLQKRLRGRARMAKRDHRRANPRPRRKSDERHSH